MEIYKTSKTSSTATRWSPLLYAHLPGVHQP